MVDKVDWKEMTRAIGVFFTTMSENIQKSIANMRKWEKEMDDLRRMIDEIPEDNNGIQTDH